MTLQEAIKSGRPFRNPMFADNWYWWIEHGKLVAGEYPEPKPEHNNIHASVEDVLRTDWEILEPTVTLTASQLRNAITSSIVHWWQDDDANWVVDLDDFAKEVLKRLGLEG